MMETSGVSFQELEAQAPEFAATARRMLTEDGGPSVAFIATVARDGRPRLAPFSPIFSGSDLFLSAGARTPKRYDLENDGRYVLHAMLGESDEELQLAGRAERHRRCRRSRACARGHLVRVRRKGPRLPTHHRAVSVGPLGEGGSAGDVSGAPPLAGPGRRVCCLTDPN